MAKSELSDRQKRAKYWCLGFLLYNLLLLFPLCTHPLPLGTFLDVIAPFSGFQIFIHVYAQYYEMPWLRTAGVILALLTTVPPMIGWLLLHLKKPFGAVLIRWGCGLQLIIAFMMIVSMFWLRNIFLMTYGVTVLSFIIFILLPILTLKKLRIWSP